MSRPRVSIVIPTYNSSDYIEKLLHYVKGLHPYHIYVIDDASTDDTVKKCRRISSVTVIAGDTNVGPTRNRNRILGRDIGDIILFLDDDMRWLSGDVLKTIANHFANPSLGALGFAIFDTEGKELWFGNEHESSPLLFWLHRPFITPLKPHERKKTFLPVQWLLEGAFAVRSDIFTRLDGFDERFTRYQEGPDLCRRIRLDGHIIGYTHDVQFEHMRPLSVFRPDHAGLYLKAGWLWHAKHGWFPKQKSKQK